MSSTYYLDSTAECGSSAILRQLGVAHATSPKNAKVVELASAWAVEHKHSSEVTLVASEGVLAVDVRDSADCWLRILLSPQDGALRVPAGLYMRVQNPIPSSKASLKVSSGEGVSSITPRYSEAGDGVEVVEYHKYRELVCELCRQFFDAGWVTGTGGSISIRHGNRIYMTPSGVQKERILPDELYVLDIDGAILSVPNQKPGCKLPKLSDCSPLFLHAFQQRNAGAVLHSHAYCCNLVTSMFEGESEFRISHQEMIKGIQGYGYFDELRIPIIENTAWEHELADSLGECIRNNPKACAVLVRRHGMYVWGDTWEQAKRHGECLHYLFDVAINMRRLGMDFNSPPRTVVQSNADNKKRRLEDVSDPHEALVVRNNHFGSSVYKHVIFDIEGTTTPITFVKDVLFPYAATQVKSFLESTWDTDRTQDDIKQLQALALEDSTSSGSTNVLPTSSSKADLLGPLVDFVQTCITQDRKVGALKQLQGHIWDLGYVSGDLKSIVYDDVPACFDRLKKEGKQVSIYSSGSREAQKLLFKYSNHGDLRHFLSCYFDTKIGMKVSISSLYSTSLRYRNLTPRPFFPSFTARSGKL
jgi:methylthioribulose 1-phosphate dehydratase/enolase-phosphatase E1